MGFDPKLIIPLSLGYLKSNIEQEHEVSIFDFTLDNIPYNSSAVERRLRAFDPQVVGVSCWSTTYREAINILKKVKSIGERIVTVVGGVHATSYPDSVMSNKEVDFLIRGEAELTFSRLLAELRQERPDFSKVKGLVYRSTEGTIVQNEIDREEDLDKVKIPDYDAIRLDDYIKAGYRYSSDNKRNAPILVTRGCPYRCKYCAGPIQNGRLIRSHSIDYIVEWVKFLYYDKGIRTINIIDDNFTFYTDYAKRFCEAMIGLNLRDLDFGTPNGIRMQRVDKELFKLMKRAGWKTIFIAPESGSVKTLERMKKDLDPSIVPQKVREIKEAGLEAVGFFMVGYPGETREDLQETAKLIRRCKFDYFIMFKFQPLPGTPVYNDLVINGDISSDFVPVSQFSGNTPYIPIGLQDYNFGLFQLKEYAHLILTNPSSIAYVLKHYDHKYLVRSMLYNFQNIFKA